MAKRILVIILILALGASVLWFINPISPAVKASADTYKAGFSITPTKYDDSGIALDTQFNLTSRNPVTLDYLKENLSIRGQEPPDIIQNADGIFVITPAEPLSKNSLYIIDIKTTEGGTVSFAFQTPKDFAIIGCLPENTSSGVPVDTGIEIYFSYAGVTGMENYFEITPHVDGRFEYHGYAVSFVPKKLEPGTIYTVTVKKGLKVEGAPEALAEDYRFSFETAPDSSVTADPSPGSLSMGSNWFDFSTLEALVIPFDIWLSGRADFSDVKVTAAVYRFDSLDSFLDAVREADKYPMWAWYSYSRNKTDVSGLEKVMEFSQTFNLERWQERFMMFPEALPGGFYIVELTSGKLSAQAFLQSSDIASFMIEGKDSRVFWVNNLRNGNSENSAEITDLATGKTARTNDKGLASLEGASLAKDDESTSLDLYKITTAGGSIAILNAGYVYGTRYYPGMEGSDLYWRYLQTDRNLYKPDDTIYFWGFLKSRIDGSTPSRITVDISEGGYFPMFSRFMQWYLPFITKPLETVTLNTEGGFFDGSIKLPSLDPGSYALTVKSGEQVLSVSYISVENYIKPQYKLEITSDKKAVFTGEKITFTVEAAFFDGTPVANVPIRYNIGGWSRSASGDAVTDTRGRVTIEYVPQYESGMQGQSYFYINASASLPETGEISQHHSFMVFPNDITLRTAGELKDGVASLSLTSSKVVLDTLNDDDPANDDYVGPADPDRKINVSIYKNTWMKIETGETYDFINKVVRKTYEYRQEKELILSRSLTTDSLGEAGLEFPVDSNFEGYYSAEITATDSKGHSMKYETGFYSKGGIRYPSYNDYYHLKADKDSYGSGETVNISFHNNDNPVTGFRTLFVESRNGIFGYDVMSQPVYSKAFNGDLAPNYYVDGIMFTGKSYIQSNCVVPYRYEEKKLTLTVETDKESYRPGDMCTVKVKAVDENGNPVASMVNISLVDEALLQLSGRYIDPLGYLYSWINSGILRYSTNRNNQGYYGIRFGAAQPAGAESSKWSMADDQAPAPSAAPNMAAANGVVFDTTVVRSDFKDTACFETIKLGNDGEGELTFKLPDNITSFSLAAAAVSSDLYAGSEIASTRVTMPFFLSDSLSLTYLAGDTPYIGVTAYGLELAEDEDITFEIRCKELNYVKTVSGKAFERTNIPLPRLSAGTYNIEMFAGSESGLTDGVKRTVQVYDSYRTIETSTLKKLAKGVSIDAGKSGLTTLIFTDESRARIINALHGLSWGYGHRLDQKLVAKAAQNMLRELLDSNELYFEEVDVDTASYRNDDGGYGILPYAMSDMKLTALLTPYLKDVADMNSLKMYFYNAVLTEETINAAALYGLAILEEPILRDLEKAANTENLSITDYMLIGMAYQALGETSVAHEIYTERIQKHVERKDPYTRVKVKNNDTDACLEQTALLAAFTSGLGMEESDRMYAYLVANAYSSKNVYTGVERLMYLSNRLNALPDEKVGFTYNYNGTDYTVDLEGGRSEMIKIPSVKASSFKVTGVTGNASVLSLFMAPLNQNVKNDDGISITRRYYNALTGEETSTFSQNDIVRVEITYDIRKVAIDNIYEISDYAPSGLKPIDYPWRYGVQMKYGWFYRNIDGQKVTFVVSKNSENREPLVYYARVASPGEYTAEGTVAQGSVVKSSMTVNGNSSIKILP